MRYWKVIIFALIVINALLLGVYLDQTIVISGSQCEWMIEYDLETGETICIPKQYEI